MPDFLWKPGQHAPPHLFVADWLYMLTGATYKQKPIIDSAERKREWIGAFLSAAKLHKWNPIAWVVMDTHYHAILKSPTDNATGLPKFVASYHKFTAQQWNRQDDLPGRRVWYNYWDTCIRSEEDLRNRLRYVFWNPVKHGLVAEPAEYPFSNFDNFLGQEWFNIGPAPIEVKHVPKI